MCTNARTRAHSGWQRSCSAREQVSLLAGPAATASRASVARVLVRDSSSIFPESSPPERNPQRRAANVGYRDRRRPAPPERSLTERDLRPPRREVRTNLRPRPCRPPTPRVHRFPPLARSHAPSHVVARPTARARRALDPIPSLVPSPSLARAQRPSFARRTRRSRACPIAHVRACPTTEARRSPIGTPDCMRPSLAHCTRHPDRTPPTARSITPIALSIPRSLTRSRGAVARSPTWNHRRSRSPRIQASRKPSRLLPRSKHSPTMSPYAAGSRARRSPR